MNKRVPAVKVGPAYGTTKDDLAKEIAKAWNSLEDEECEESIATPEMLEHDNKLASKLLCWVDVSTVLFRHYGEEIMLGTPEGLAAWAIMQDVRTHLGLTEEQTHGLEESTAMERIWNIGNIG